MGAFALLFTIWFAIGVVFLVAMLFLGVGVISAVSSSGDPSAAAGALGGTIVLIFVVFALVVLLITIVTQFLDVAVVGGGADATGSFGESIELVTSGPLSVLGYSILRAVLAAVVIGVPFVGGLAAVLWGLDDAGTLPILMGIGVMILALPAGFAFMYSYHVAYYRRRVDATA